jgi:pyrroline-5-carboxylate reductase
VNSNFASAKNIIASDVLAASREKFTAETGARAVENNADVFANSDVVILAVKPQQMAEVLKAAKAQIKASHLIVSIAAGVSLKTMTDVLGAKSRLVRVMPNTPCLVGKGASAFALGGKATEEDGQVVEQLLSTVGIAISVPEKLLDAVTGLSGSGPAYVYLAIEAMSDGGVRTGLPRDIATKLAAQTVLGAAAMVLETGEHPAALKDAVASPGGTTIAGLHALENGGLRSALINAVEAATLRSRELGQSS